MYGGAGPIAFAASAIRVLGELLAREIFYWLVIRGNFLLFQALR